MKRLIVAGTGVAAVLGLAACGGTATRPSGPAPAAVPVFRAGPAEPVVTADPGIEEPVSTLIDARPAALVNGQTVRWGDLRPALNEIAGGQALQDLILDRRVTAELLAAGRSISESDIARERRIMLETLSDDPSTALRLLDDLRARQGLGRLRFDALLRRNAGLRALVAGDVRIDETTVRRMYDLTHGPRRQVRIIVVPDIADAQSARRRVLAGEPFADVAVSMSTDASAARGGLLEPIARDDPNYPAAVVQTAWTLERGAVSQPLLVEREYVLVELYGEISADGVGLEEVRPALERAGRRNQERLLMDQLARRLVQGAAVTIFDEELNASWNMWRR